MSIVNRTVIFNANGGSPSSTRIVQSGRNVGALPAVTRAGHTFAGWWTARSGGSNINLNTIITANVTFGARWQAIVRIVTFNANGGNINPPFASARSVQNASAIGTLPTATRANHIFIGWWTSRTGGVQVSANTIINANITLYARWTINNVIIIFNPNEGSVNVNSMTVLQGMPVTDMPIPTGANHIFMGWFTDGGIRRDNGFVPTENITLYAKWEKDGTINNGQLNHVRVVQQPTSMGYDLSEQRQLSVIDRITVHHTVGNPNATVADLNVIWRNRGWNRAGYHFAIRPDGTIWQLVPINVFSNGAGNPLNFNPAPNTRSIHIVFMGDFRVPNIPAQASGDSYSFLCRLLLGNSQLPNLFSINDHVVGHRQWRNGGADDCPGITREQYLSWI